MWNLLGAFDWLSEWVFQLPNRMFFGFGLRWIYANKFGVKIDGKFMGWCQNWLNNNKWWNGNDGKYCCRKCGGGHWTVKCRVWKIAIIANCLKTGRFSLVTHLCSTSIKSPSEFQLKHSGLDQEKNIYHTKFVCSHFILCQHSKRVSPFWPQRTRSCAGFSSPEIERAPKESLLNFWPWWYIWLWMFWSNNLCGKVCYNTLLE